MVSTLPHAPHTLTLPLGTIKGVQYFSCPNKRGMMVKPSDIRPFGLDDK